MGTSQGNGAGKAPVRGGGGRFKIRLEFEIQPRVLRKTYIKVIHRLIERAVKLINDEETPVKVTLRAMEIVGKLIQATYVLIRDVEIEQLEQEIKRLEAEDRGASPGVE